MANQVSIIAAPEHKNWVVTGKISNIGETKTGNHNGKSWARCDITLKDEHGEGTITLWNDEIAKVETNKVYTIQGYTKEYDGKKSLAVGKFGRIDSENDEPKPTSLKDAITVSDASSDSNRPTIQQVYEKQQLILESISAIFRILVDLQLAKKENLPDFIKKQMEDKSS